MECGCSNGKQQVDPSHHGCGCGGQGVQNHPLWSKKKKIRFLETRLQELNEQKTDIEELIEELKVKS